MGGAYLEHSESVNESLSSLWKFSVGGYMNFKGEPTERVLVSGKLKFRSERESTDIIGFPLYEVVGGIFLLIID